MEPQIQCVTVRIRTRRPSAPVSRLPLSIQRPRQSHGDRRSRRSRPPRRRAVERSLLTFSSTSGTGEAYRRGRARRGRNHTLDARPGPRRHLPACFRQAIWPRIVPASVSFLRLLIRQLAVRGKRRLAGQPPIPGRHSAVAWWPRRCRGQDGPQCCAGRTGLQAVGWLCSAAVP